MVQGRSCRVFFRNGKTECEEIEGLFSAVCTSQNCFPAFLRPAFSSPHAVRASFSAYSNLYKVYFRANDTTMLIATSTETAWLPMATIEAIPPQCIDNFYSVGRDLILAYDWHMEKLANITCYPPAASMWWNQKASQAPLSLSVLRVLESRETDLAPAGTDSSYISPQHHNTSCRCYNESHRYGHKSRPFQVSRTLHNSVCKYQGQTLNTCLLLPN